MEKSRLPMTLFEYLDPVMLEATLLYFSAVEDNKSIMFLLKPVELDFCHFPLKAFRVLSDTASCLLT